MPLLHDPDEAILASPLPASLTKRLELTPEEAERATGDVSLESPLLANHKRKRASEVKIDLTSSDDETVESATCRGCREDILNQGGHMDHGGCMYESTPQPWQDDPPQPESACSTYPTLVANWTCDTEGEYAVTRGPISVSFIREHRNCKIHLRSTNDTLAYKFEATIEASVDGSNGVFRRTDDFFVGYLGLPWEKGPVDFHIRIAEVIPDTAVPFWDDDADIARLWELFERASADGKETDSILAAVKRGTWSAEDAFVVWRKEPAFVDAFLGSEVMNVDGIIYARVLEMMKEHDDVPGFFAGRMLERLNRRNEP